MKRNIIVSAILLALLIATACLKLVWAGFIYFSLSFLIILCLYWLAMLITYYYEDYYLYFEEDFKEYKAELINSTTLTSEEFEQNIEAYIKKYKKTQRKYKAIDIFKILFLLAVIVVCIVAMARGKF